MSKSTKAGNTGRTGRPHSNKGIPAADAARLGTSQASKGLYACRYDPKKQLWTRCYAVVESTGTISCYSTSSALSTMVFLPLALRRIGIVYMSRCQSCCQSLCRSPVSAASTAAADGEDVDTTPSFKSPLRQTESAATATPSRRGGLSGSPDDCECHQLPASSSQLPNYLALQTTEGELPAFIRFVSRKNFEEFSDFALGLASPAAGGVANTSIATTSAASSSGVGQPWRPTVRTIEDLKSLMSVGRFPFPPGLYDDFFDQRRPTLAAATTTAAAAAAIPQGHPSAVQHQHRSEGVGRNSSASGAGGARRLASASAIVGGRKASAARLLGGSSGGSSLFTRLESLRSDRVAATASVGGSVPPPVHADDVLGSPKDEAKASPIALKKGAGGKEANSNEITDALPAGSSATTPRRSSRSPAARRSGKRSESAGASAQRNSCEKGSAAKKGTFTPAKDVELVPMKRSGSVERRLGFGQPHQDTTKTQQEGDVSAATQQSTMADMERETQALEADIVHLEDQLSFSEMEAGENSIQVIETELQLNEAQEAVQEYTRRITSVTNQLRVQEMRLKRKMKSDVETLLTALKDEVEKQHAAMGESRRAAAEAEEKEIATLTARVKELEGREAASHD